MKSVIETFFEAWAVADASARAEMIAGTLAPDATYSDPRSGGRLTGDAIAEYVSAFSANAPGWTANVEHVSDVNGYFRVRVAFGGQGPVGAMMIQHGTYFVDAGDNGLKTIAGFVGAEA